MEIEPGRSRDRRWPSRAGLHDWPRLLHHDSGGGYTTTSAQGAGSSRFQPGLVPVQVRSTTLNQPQSSTEPTAIPLRDGQPTATMDSSNAAANSAPGAPHRLVIQPESRLLDVDLPDIIQYRSLIWLLLSSGLCLSVQTNVGWAPHGSC